MKHFKRVLALFLSAMLFLVPINAFANQDGEVASHYIKAIINKIYEDYRFNANKEAMYEAVLDYVMHKDPSLLEGAIKAVTDTLDDYSDYMTREELSSFIDSVENAYVGIGVTVEETPEGLLIVDVSKNSGAFSAGIQIGDVILDVNGESIIGKPLAEATQNIRGEAGTSVVLTILRGEETLTLIVERRRVLAETVGYTIENDKVGYIYISEFATSTVSSVESALSAIEEKGIKKFIIDVRDNPGGSLASVIDVLSLFVPKGKVLTKLEYNDKRFSSTLKSTADFRSKPNRKIVVLANEQSASAAELFSGAMQNLGYAKVVGRRTFGKGSMQEMLGLINPPGFSLGDIKLSVAEFTLPDGKPVNKVGIKPDVDVRNEYVPVDTETLTPMTISARYAVGDQADDVLAIEERLDILGYYTGNIDGVFDTFTERATKQFQSDMNLCSYGVMDYTTQGALNNKIAETELVVDKQFETAYNLLIKE